jgi:hypothetical protein
MILHAILQYRQFERFVIVLPLRRLPPQRLKTRSTVPALDEVYRKFGETAEAAQLLETELGTMLLTIRASDKGLFGQPNQTLAEEILRTIDRQTLGQLLKNLKGRNQSFDGLESLLWNALEERNRLFHSFYRQHNFRRNCDEGRELMLRDLGAIHDALLNAYQAVMLLSGVDLKAMAATPPTLPTRHVPI